MATNPSDVFAPLRVSGPQASTPTAPPSAGADVFAPLRIPGTDSAPIRPSVVSDNSLGEEFIAGLGQGVNSFQGSLFGVAGLLGRELGIGWLEEAGYEGAKRNFEEAGQTGRQSGGFSDIESAGGFFKWASASLGEAIPSLASMFTGAGIGVSIGKKAIENGVKRSLARRIERDLTGRFGFDKGAALEAASGLMNSKTGQTMLAKAFTTGRSGAVIAKAAGKATTLGGRAGGFIAATLPQIGAIDQELVSAGIVDPGLTALIGGIAGGALELAPALRLMDKMFPGVDRQVAKIFVKDFAISTGTQLALEGSTEAAQELIQLAALAYHDPTFDMFSPDAKRRVIDAFAAGALVGAVTGGGAEAVGSIGPAIRKIRKVAPPKIEKWKMDIKAGVANVKQKAEDGAEGFVAADNTVFEEIRSRIYSTVAPKIEAAINSARNQFQPVADKLNSVMEGGLNVETASFGQLVKAAHNQFIKDHAAQIKDAMEYIDKRSKWITETAAQIKDPEQRAKFVEDHINAVTEKLSGFMEKMRQSAAKRDQNLGAEIDNMDFEGVLEELGDTLNDELLDQESEPGVSEVDAEPALVFGKGQKGKVVTVSGKTKVAGYHDRPASVDKDGKVIPAMSKEEMAAKGMATLRNEFPEATDDDFEIVNQEDGTLVIETVNPELMATHRFNEAQKASRRSANSNDDTRRHFMLPLELIKKLGLKITNPLMDIVTLAHRGKDLDPDFNGSLRDGLQNMIAEMLVRGHLDVESANAMLDKFDKLMKAEPHMLQEPKGRKKTRAQEAADTKKGFASPVVYQSDGAAWGALLEFMKELDALGVPYPFSDDKGWGGKFSQGSKLFTVVKIEGGKWMWGFDRSKKAAPRFKALAAKDPAVVRALMSAIHTRRRNDALDVASRKQGDFSAAPTGEGGGDLGDTTGATAQRARIRTTKSIDEFRNPDNVVDRDGRTVEAVGGNPRNQPRIVVEESQRTELDILTGELKLVTEKGQIDEDPQADDLVTDPDKLPSEFQDRVEELQRTSSEKNSQTAPDAKNPQTAEDNRLLGVIGRKGKVKILFGNDADSDGSLMKAVKDLVTFVHKKLGLANDIIVMDDKGLAMLIESGTVSDPVFKETLENPSVTARNIRIGDKSFIYLSPRVLANDSFTVLALGHELGHHLFSVAWGNLTDAGKQRLRGAFISSRGKATNTEGKFNQKDFNEWMADQLAAWITTRRGPRGAVEAFFARVSGKIRRLYEFVHGYGIIKNERFALNETFGAFADAVALLASRAAPSGADPLGDSELRSWFKNEGVTMYKSWGRLPLTGKKQTTTGKKRTTTNRKRTTNNLHTQNDLQDIMYRKQLEIDSLQEELEAMTDADTIPARASDMYERIQALEEETDQIANEINSLGAEVDNMDLHIEEHLTPVTDGGKKALERILKNYPLIAKRAIPLRNWVVKAYSLVLAPSTSVIRSIGKRVKVANKFVSIFGRENHGEAKKGSNYHQRVNFWKGQFLESQDKGTDNIGYNKIVAHLTSEQRTALARSLSKKDGDPGAAFTTEELAIRHLFDRMHAYAIASGLPVSKVVNYLPRQFGTEKLVQGKQEILNHLIDDEGMTVHDARAFYNSLISADATDGRATRDATETPSFTNMNSRTARDKFFDKYLDDNLDGIVMNYINALVKRAEFNRFLGEAMPAGTELSANELIKAGIWDPKAKLKKMMKQARKEGATDEDLVMLEKYVDANLGQLGRDDIRPGVRKWMAAVMGYQNLRVLLFTVFASLPDLAGPAIRAGDMRLAFNAVKNNMHNMAKNDNDLAQMARAYGIISSTMSEHMMTEYVDNHHMPATMRKWNNVYFKYTGLNWYTDFTRKMALAVGIDYLAQQAQIMKDGDEKQAFKARDRLKELGLTEAMVDKWVKAGKPQYDSQAHEMDSDGQKIAEALIQFVDESIMRPNAAQRPLLASHPGLMLVYHLKNYLYAVHEVVLKRISFNIKESDNPAQLTAAIAPAIGMLLFTAIGLELRELIQYAGSNRKPPTDRMDGWEYMWELFQRSGLSGISQIAIDFEGAEDRGLSHVAGVMGPTLSQGIDILSKPKTQTIPKAIPIVGQIPALRKVVRDVVR